MSTVNQNFSSAGDSTKEDSWLSGFLLLGVFLGALGSLLIAWDYHVDGDPRTIGLHFLGLSAGYLIGSQLYRSRALELRLRGMALVACSVGFASLLALSFLAPPMPPVWRILALSALGFAGGSLSAVLLSALEPAYAARPAQNLNRSGIFFGAGCFLATLVTGLLNLAGRPNLETVLLSLTPLVFFVRYASARAAGPTRSAGRRSGDLRLVAAYLFTMLLLCQFGNEWAIAGWLPLFLIHTLGNNPGYAIFALALYFLVLTLGRVLAQRVIGRLRPGRLLIASIVISMSGYLLLSLSQSLADAYLGIVITALGFGPVYPVVLQTLDERFTYQAGFYNRILSISVTGGLAAPWLLGYVDAYFGMRSIMLLPALGSAAVLLLALLIMLEARLMGRPHISTQSNLV